jgi:RNase adaptor protein for sRNA GlmZ degradation
MAAKRQVVSALRDRTDFVIEAPPPAALNLQRLADRCAALLPGMRVFVTSFPYRHEVPRDAERIVGRRFSLRPSARLPLPMGTPTAAV